MSISPATAADPSHDDMVNEAVKTGIHVKASALQSLADQLPEVNQLLESSFEQISGDFIALTDKISRMKALSLPESAHTDSLNKELQAMESSIRQIVVGLQFQDRVSQNLVIVTNVINEILRHQESEPPDELISAILEQMKLGEFRQKFVNLCLQRQLISEEMAESLCNTSAAQPANSAEEDDIELF